jgi:cupin 2 domain-containing protein
MKPRAQTGNLFVTPSSAADGEQTDILLSAGPFRLERIVSFGTASPQGFWYEQGRPEWVLLARGRARLAFEGDEPVELETGDYVLIPAGVRHRVEGTSSDAIWLALHFTPRGS